MDHPMHSPKQRSAAFKGRREFFEVTAAVALTAAAGLALTGCGQAEEQKQGDTPKTTSGPTMEALMADPPLPDIVEGKDAPVTIVEYASMTCGHCAAFHANTYPALISKYVDTGKVRFILREFPLDPLATAAFMLARCSGPEKRDAVVGLLFQQQKNWVSSNKPIEALASIVKQTGMSQDSFKACLTDDSLRNKIDEMRDIAERKFGVEATPTFFINGTKHSGEFSAEDLDKLLEPFLKG
jgi:protein-disulfide isomerase